MAGHSKYRLTTWLCLAVSLVVAEPALAGAQPGPSLSGKTVRMLIGIGVGGGYDAWGRLVARHLGKHLPGNPTLVPENMPGGGSFVAASYIYNIAPKDGTVLGIISRDAAAGAIMGLPGAHFDPIKLSWIGTPTAETNVCVAREAARVKTVNDLYSTELIVGDTGAGAGDHIYPNALDQLLGMKFKTISGFPSTVNILLAIERGEVDGICETLAILKNSRPYWFAQHKINVLFQGGSAPDPELKGVPFIVDLGKTEEQKKALRFLYIGQGIGRPFVAPPEMPPDRLKMLRDAFNATMNDPDFLADAKRQKLTIYPKTGEQLTELIDKVYATPKSIMQIVRNLTRAPKQEK